MVLVSGITVAAQEIEKVREGVAVLMNDVCHSEWKVEERERFWDDLGW